MKTGDVMVMELGKFNDNSSMTRLVKAQVEEVSFDGKKAIVKLLPPDPNKKDVIQAERLCAGKSRVIGVEYLFRDEKHYRDSCEFKVGDVVAVSMWNSDIEMATVTKVKRLSLQVTNSFGKTYVAYYGNTMVVSRPE